MEQNNDSIHCKSETKSNSKAFLFFSPEKYFFSCDDQKSELEAREVRSMKKNKQASFFTEGGEKFWKPPIGREASHCSNQKGSESGWLQ